MMTEVKQAPSEERARHPTGVGPKPKAVVHLTVAERAEKGKAARLAAPRAEHGEWAAGGRSARSGRVAGGAGGVAGARARPDPLRTHARLAVHVLPRCRVSDGGRPGRRAADRARRAALRRRAPVQLRGLRRARPAAGVQHQRLRRDAAGPVRVGRQAAGGQLRGGRPRSRVRRQAAALDQPGGQPGLPRGDPGVRRDVEPRPLVLAHRRRRDRRARGRARRPGRTASGSRRNLAKARSKDSLRALAKLTTDRRR